MYGRYGRTDTYPRVMNARRTVMELILSNHPAECLTCSSNGHCELQKIAHDPGIREIRYKGEMSTFTIDRSPSIVRNMNKCIMCRRCETMCNTIQTVGALTAVNRGFNAPYRQLSNGIWPEVPVLIVDNAYPSVL